MPTSASSNRRPDRTGAVELRQALFAPRAVALVGASGDPKKLAARPQRVLRRHGYTGRIVPINPSRSEIAGDDAYPSLRAAPGPIDHAFVMVPAPAVPAVIAECCELGIPLATIFSAGFAELGEEGRRRQEQMVAMARAAGTRLLGPNCLGVMNVTGRVAISANAVLEREEFRPGPLSVISQSGSMLGSIITRAQARGLGFSKLVSVGNESDLMVGELAELLVDDPDTQAILLFLETFRDAARLARAARRAYEAGKPVIAYKLGRSGVGREVANSHTGALTGPDEVANAFFCAHGIMRVEQFETLFELPPLVIGKRPGSGRRAAVLTGTGGAAAMVVDRLGAAGVDVVAPPPRGDKPLAVFIAPKADEALAILQRAGVAGFRTPETCADAVRAYCEWRAPCAEVAVDRDRVEAARRLLAGAAPGALNESGAAEVFSALGVPVAESQVIRDAREAVHLPFPVAAKVLSRDVAHKSDAGAVALDLAGPLALARATAAMLARVRALQPAARIDGVLVQRMAHGVAEVIVGFRRDREVGPIVMVGAGGILAELVRGQAVRVAPVALEEARAMVVEVPALAVLRGYRGGPPGDVEALARAIHAVSLLACIDTPRVAEAEINPLIVQPDGVVAVDALLVVAS